MQVTPSYANNGRIIPTIVITILTSTVFLRPHLFIRLPIGIPKNKNQTNAIEGTNPVIIGDQLKLR